MVINHILLLAKFYIYRSKLDNTKPSLEVFKAKLKATLNTEFVIAKRNGNRHNVTKSGNPLFPY